MYFFGGRCHPVNTRGQIGLTLGFQQDWFGQIRQAKRPKYFRTFFLKKGEKKTAIFLAHFGILPVYCAEFLNPILSTAGFLFSPSSQPPHCSPPPPRIRSTRGGVERDRRLVPGGGAQRPGQAVGGQARGRNGPRAAGAAAGPRPVTHPRLPPPVCAPLLTHRADPA